MSRELLSCLILSKVSARKYRSSVSRVFLGKDVLKIYSTFTGEHQCQNVISIKLQSNFIEIALGHGFFPVNLLHIFRISFPKNTSGGLLLFVLTHISYHWCFSKNERFSDIFRGYKKGLVAWNKLTWTPVEVFFQTFHFFRVQYQVPP